MSHRYDEGVCRYIDMWAMPGMHPCNIEFLQQLKTADTNHFTTHMDCVGKISEHDTESGAWRKTHLIGIRTDVWRPDKKEMKGVLASLQDRRRSQLRKQIKRSGRLSDQQRQRLEQQLAEDSIMLLQTEDLVSRRLVLKLFKTTGKRVRWVGTIEQVTTSEVHNSMGSNRTLLSFAVMLPRTQFLTHLQQNHRTLRIPSVFTGCFYEEEQMWHLMMLQRWIAFGTHFDIKIDGQRIGEIDSRLLSFGADSTLRVGPHPLASDTRFLDTLTLFACTVGYHKAMRRSVKQRVAAVASGESYRHWIEDEELRLRHNGRSAA